MQPLARALSHAGPPFAWNEARRARLRGGSLPISLACRGPIWNTSRARSRSCARTRERQHGDLRAARLALAAYELLAPEMAGVAARSRAM